MDSYIILRISKGSFEVTNRKGVTHKSTSYEPGAITVAYEICNKERPTVHVGLAFNSPRDSFNKRIGRKIASGRMVSNPLRFVPEDEKGQVKGLVIRDVIFLVKSFLLAKTKWEPAGDAFRPARFKHQWSAHLLGRLGNVFLVFADGNASPRTLSPKGKDIAPVVIEELPTYGWAFRCIPGWASEFARKIE